MSDPNPGGYSLGNIFKKEPAVIAAAVLAVFPALVLLGVETSAETLAGIELALAPVIALFYVRPAVNTEATAQRREIVAYEDGVKAGGLGR